MVTRSPTPMGWRSSRPSTETVATGRRQWRLAASTPTTSIHSRIFPARRKPSSSAMSGATHSSRWARGPEVTSAMTQSVGSHAAMRNATSPYIFVPPGGGSTFALRRAGDLQLLELGRIGVARGAGHEIGALLRLRERDHVAQAL